MKTGDACKILFCGLVVLIFFCGGCGGSDDSTSGLVNVDVEYPSQLGQVSKDLIVEGSLFKTSALSDGDKVSGPAKAISKNNDNTNFEFQFASVPNGTYYLQVLFKNNGLLASSKSNSSQKSVSKATVQEQCEQDLWELSKQHCQSQGIEDQCKQAIKEECAKDTSTTEEPSTGGTTNAQPENNPAPKTDDNPILASLTAQIAFEDGKNVHISFRQTFFNLSYDDNGDGLTNLSEVVGTEVKVDSSTTPMAPVVSAPANGTTQGGSTQGTPIALPVAPTGLVATPSNGQNTIDWNPVVGATSYNLYWSTSSGVNKTNGTKIQNATKPFVHTGLNNGATYYYVVTAVNAVGESAAPPQILGIPVSPIAGQWTSRNSGVTTQLWDIAYGNNIFVAVVLDSSNSVLTSPDGIQWTMRSIQDNYFTAVTYGLNIFAMVGYYGRILTSPDSINWTPRHSGTTRYLYAAAYGNNTLVVAGNNGIISSSDGVTWIARNLTEYLRGITYTNNTFIAVGANGKILTSPDGITWTSRSSGTTTSLNAIAYGNGLFVAVGSNIILTSPDGITWTERGSYFLNDITYAQNTFVAVGSNGTIITSSDGVNWTSRNSGTTETLLGIAYADNRFVVVGQRGTILTSP